MALPPNQIGEPIGMPNPFDILKFDINGTEVHVSYLREECCPPKEFKIKYDYGSPIQYQLKFGLEYAVDWLKEKYPSGIRPMTYQPTKSFFFEVTNNVARIRKIMLLTITPPRAPVKKRPNVEARITTKLDNNDYLILSKTLEKLSNLWGISYDLSPYYNTVGQKPKPTPKPTPKPIAEPKSEKSNALLWLLIGGAILYFIMKRR